MEIARLRTLHREMLRIRVVEERIAQLYSEQEMRCPTHLCIGQEATAVGACAALAKEDYVFSAHRAHGHFVARGGSMRAMLAEIYGRTTGCCGGRGGSMHLIDLDVGFLGAVPIVGSTLPMAVGAALASATRGEKRVTMVFFGEGTTEEGVFHESLDFAVLKRLPVVFLCENNLYSVYSPLEVRQSPGRSVARLAEAHGVPSAVGDGNDVREVERLASRAVAEARAGGGPRLVELSTYRWREHCGPNYDNDIGYRTPEEFLAWKARCPVARFERELRAERALDDETLSTLLAEVEAEVEDAIRFAKESPSPRREGLLDHVYAPTRTRSGSPPVEQATTR